jgi:RNA polymerase sigma-70 factor, ECF subfamily
MTSLNKLLGAHLQEQTYTAKELYEKYAPGFLGICLRYCADIKDAEDVLHDGFLKIMKSRSTFQPRTNGSFEGWMKRIIVNTALNFIRDHRMEKKFLSVDSVGSEYMGTEEERQENWFEELAGRVEPERVMAMIGALPVGYRTVFNMYVFESFTHKEIAEVLNCSENTSKSQLSKARAMLRKMIREQYHNTLENKDYVQTSGR